MVAGGVVMSNVTMDYMNPSTLRREGIRALSEALTPVGMAYFFRQIESGEGNYTDEKDELTKHYTTESIMNELMAIQNK